MPRETGERKSGGEEVSVEIGGKRELCSSGSILKT